MVHAALLSLGRQRKMRYLHHYATTNSLPCYFVASWRLNYILKHIIHTSTLVTVFTVRLGEHNFMVLTYLLTLGGHAPRRRHIAEKLLYSKRVLYHNFLAPVVSKVIWGSKICIRGPAPPGRPLAEKFWHTPFPQVLAYTYITVKFQLRSSTDVRLTESSVYNRLCI